MQNPVPVILVSGFLGAGKTTFINTLIHKYPDKKISLILNEFGNVKLESQFIEQKEIGLVTELNNGCLCCVANVDLPRVITYTLDHAPQTEYLLIEASGLSDPDPVRATLQSDALATRIRLDTSVVIVDADNFAKTAPNNPLILSQIADADLAYISKIKGHSSEELLQLQERVSNIGLGTRTLLWGDASDLSLVFDPPLSAPKSTSSAHSHASHTQYDSYLYETTQLLDLAKLKQLISNFPNNILRVKGYVVADTHKYLIQRVGNHLDVRVVSINPEDREGSVILIIGTELLKAELSRQLEGCLL